MTFNVLKTFLLGLFIGNCYAQFCPADREEPWSYSNLALNGPLFWGFTYNDCFGSSQSPIALSRDRAQSNEALPALDLVNYNQPVASGTILNNGHTIQVNTNDDVSRMISANGIEYSLQQLHFHWGKFPKMGSEHTLDGKRYAMEMHLVHMNDDGKIAVVGVFFEEGDEDNEEMQKIVDELGDVKYKGQEKEFLSDLNLNNLLPSNPASFYRYEGSLTTPACSEGVTWSVIPDPMPIGKSQMKKFREVYSTEQDKARPTCRLYNNFRPIQAQNNRTVYLSQ